jgi:hypothetical protein
MKKLIYAPGWEPEVFVPVAVAAVTALLTLLGQALPAFDPFFKQFDPTITGAALITLLGLVWKLVDARITRSPIDDYIEDVE